MQIEYQLLYCWPGASTELKATSSGILLVRHFTFINKEYDDLTCFQADGFVKNFVKSKLICNLLMTLLKALDGSSPCIYNFNL